MEMYLNIRLHWHLLFHQEDSANNISQHSRMIALRYPFYTFTFLSISLLTQMHASPNHAFTDADGHEIIPVEPKSYSVNQHLGIIVPVLGERSHLLVKRACKLRPNCG